ncbi:hypothetical protein, partial [Burkholderia sp. Ac-20379]|uniref:hypothetical protein n=1 Tax=Burkholderia sp. Ac-20379 TaxID=2703900 RepID=UPI001981CA31
GRPDGSARRRGARRRRATEQGRAGAAAGRIGSVAWVDESGNDGQKRAFLSLSRETAKTAQDGENIF